MLKPENGNVPPVTKLIEGVETIIAPATVEEKAQKEKFNSIKDAKPLLHVVEKRFGGNTATKKTEESSQAILKIHDESISQEDVNQKFLRSLSPKWNTHTIVWRNKPDIDTLSLDDLYNNLKIYEPEVKGTSSSSSKPHNT
ncbi:hypothetical protein Tco_0632759 [Tanacetum coccineum]